MEVDCKTDSIETDLFIQGHLFLLKATAALQLSKIVTIFIKGILQITSPGGQYMKKERKEGKKENNVERNKEKWKERKKTK